MIDAHDLRNRDNLLKIPNDKPGLYTWWAEEKDFQYLLERLGVAKDDIDEYVIKENGLYCIYVGIAVNESIRSRLNWHVNDSHTSSRVKHGTLSTLRQSISSLVLRNQYDKEGTDRFIDKLKIDFTVYDSPIKCCKSKASIGDKEREMLRKNLFILNIKDNNHPCAIDIKRKLKQIRKESKNG